MRMFLLEKTLVNACVKSIVKVYMWAIGIILLLIKKVAILLVLVLVILHLHKNMKLEHSDDIVTITCDIHNTGEI